MKIICYFIFSLSVALTTSCFAQSNYSKDEFNSWKKFKLKYNAIHHVDEVLFRAEEYMIFQNDLNFHPTILEVPNEKYLSDLNVIIDKMHELLPFAKEKHLHNELLFKLGKAHYLKSDFNTALAYFDLYSSSVQAVGLEFWKAKSFLQLNKPNEVRVILDRMSFVELSKSEKSIFCALKASCFQKENQIDSVILNLKLALDYSPPKRSKGYWLLHLGKLYTSRDSELANRYLQQALRADMISDAARIEANLERVKLKYRNGSAWKSAMLKLLNKGYTIGKEYLVYNEIAQLFNKEETLDSAVSYFDKVLNHDKSTVVLKSLVRWKLTNMYMENGFFDKAERNLMEIDLDSLDLFDDKSKILVKNREEWFQLRAAKSNLKNTDSLEHALNALVSFYRKYDLEEEYVGAMQELVVLSDYKNVDYLHELAWIDSVSIDNLNTAYAQKLAQQEMFGVVYNKLHTKYVDSLYSEVIKEASDFLMNNDFSLIQKSKVDYLKAFAIGHSKPVDTLLRSFENIIQNYKNTAVGKLVEKHIYFIENNKAQFVGRKYALERAREPLVKNVIEKHQEINSDSQNDIGHHNYGTLIDNQLMDLEPYYFVIMVENPSVNLTPTRYALGQYLRTKYKDSGYGHDLKLFDGLFQFISLGIFDSLEEVRLFESEVVAFLPQIIKFGEKKYTTFVIPKRILEKSKNIGDVREYLDKYK